MYKELLKQPVKPLLRLLLIICYSCVEVMHYIFRQECCKNAGCHIRRRLLLACEHTRSTEAFDFKDGMLKSLGSVAVGN